MAVTRRVFLKSTAGFALSTGLIPTVLGADGSLIKEAGVPLIWLDGDKPRYIPGTTLGIPSAPGEINPKDNFILIDGKGSQTIAQSWPLAYWPDGSVKWLALAVGDEINELDTNIRLVKSERMPDDGIRVLEESGAFWVDNGKIRLKFNNAGSVLVEEFWIDQYLVGENASVKVVLQNEPDTDDASVLNKKELESRIIQTSIENQGTERLVVKVEGAHYEGAHALFPFTLRFYIYKRSHTIKIIHTFLYDADETVSFIKGIGLSFDVLFNGEATYNRHIRFVGEGGGVFAESVKGLTGLRRDPGKGIRQAQVSGKAIQRVTDLSANVQKGLAYIPTFGDYTLAQLNANGYFIRKRTKAGFSWLHAADGRRSEGTAYLGSPKGGMAISLRHFWQSYPAQLDIKNASADRGQLIAWLWSPLAPAMDLRFYHDGMGQDTYEAQWEGLEITYEDYEPGYTSPRGVAKTSELYLTLFDQTPENNDLVSVAEFAQKPPLLTVSPALLFQKEVFGANWGLPKKTNQALGKIEDQLDRLFNFYRDEVEARSWYGFWNYGDFMHSYDEDRHVWKYDVGGFAWDNSELSTDLWLWYYYLRTGRADAFRLAEVMCRHTGEVDVYHLGEFAPLGSRHNVMHWGCSAKQLRISTAINRRFFYYLTADERTGDLLSEQVEAVRRLEAIVPLRKRLAEPVVKSEGTVYMSFGTDWGAVAAAWFTEWERTLDKSIYNRLTASMRTIAEQPQGFFTGVSYFHIASGKFDISKNREISVSHLNAAFGLVEICAEILGCIKHKAFEEAWINYCKLYNASKEERLRALGSSEGRFNLRSSHARLTAYAAFKLKDAQLAERAWREFQEEKTTHGELVSVYPPATLQEVTEWEDVSTNWAAQWGLTAIQCMHYVGDKS